jgi:hypothetical protein
LEEREEVVAVSRVGNTPGTLVFLSFTGCSSIVLVAVGFFLSVGEMSVSGSDSVGAVMEKCAECKEEVKGTDKAVDCDICKKWVHIKCGKVSNVLYGELKKVAAGAVCQGIKYLCMSCDKFFEKVKIDIKQMIEKQMELELQQEKLAKGLEEAKKDIVIIKESLNKIEEEKKQDENTSKVKVVEEIGDLKVQIGELKTKYSDVVRVNGMEGAVVVNTQQVSTSRSIQLEVSEVIERDKRKNNLVIFGVEETNDENKTKSRVNDIIAGVGVDVNKVKYFGRVGRNTSGGKIRVVRVVCEDAETRRSVLKGANRLKTMEGFERTYTSADLIKSQQELDKQLKNKLKDIRIQYKDAKINNGEIIVFDSGTRTVLYTRQQI